uniref:Ribosomal protein S8 n=1 Tax=Cavenderia fasciculata TaxID=261658 RepID=B2XXA1_CACFS|nr:ribosomal protein S8 [Cavenderia fasciculata]ABX45223.1 ribosomal protein S8 [Cavenderia fasciculata]
MQNLLYNNFASLKIGYIGKLTSISMYVNQTSLYLLKIFEKEGLIRGFKYLDIEKGKICVYLKYTPKGNGLFKDVSCISKKKQRIYLKGNKFSKINDDMNIYFVYTKQGDYMFSKWKPKNIHIGGEIKYLVRFNVIDHNLKNLMY